MWNPMPETGSNNRVRFITTNIDGFTWVLRQYERLQEERSHLEARCRALAELAHKLDVAGGLDANANLMPIGDRLREEVHAAFDELGH